MATGGDCPEMGLPDLVRQLVEGANLSMPS
jgi:hypothetical protein